MSRAEIIKQIEKSIKSLQKSKDLPSFKIPEINIEHPDNEEFGDYSTNAAMKIAKLVKVRPLELAKLINKQLLISGEKKLLEKIEVVEPGFINFYLSPHYLSNQVLEVLKKKEKYGDLKVGKGRKVQVEFISANPTGPLTIGNGRGGFTGDALANVLQKAGYAVEREYYWNDAAKSAQVIGLGKSVRGEEMVYAGDYIIDLKETIKKKYGKGDISDYPDGDVAKYAVEILKNDIKELITNKLKIKFDSWFSEQSLYVSRAIEKTIKLMKNKNLVYEKDNALWFRALKFGDNQDRVLIRSKDKSPTYLLTDIAYHLNKFGRGFDRVINIWGADHAGYVKRLLGAMEALGHGGKLEILIAQLVRIISGGEEVRVSKRRGTFITLEELVDEVGIDVARFFFLMYSLNTHMDFDLDLAKERSEKNPVYYVQYAHARICSILRKAGKKAISKNLPASSFKEKTELDLLRELNKFPELIEDIAKRYEVHRLPYYTIDLARKFHSFYNSCKVLSDDDNSTAARLSLIRACKIVLRNSLDILGVSAPEKM